MHKARVTKVLFIRMFAMKPACNLHVTAVVQTNNKQHAMTLNENAAKSCPKCSCSHMGPRCENFMVLGSTTG